MEKRQFCFTVDQLKKLKAESERTGLKMSDILRRALDMYLNYIGENKSASQKGKKKIRDKQ